MQRRYIRISELASTPDKPGRWPVAPATVWRWVAAGKLPQPVRLGPQVTAWPVAVIEQHEAEQAAKPLDPELIAARSAAGAAGQRARHAKREALAAPQPVQTAVLSGPRSKRRVLGATA